MNRRPFQDPHRQRVWLARAALLVAVGLGGTVALRSHSTFGWLALAAGVGVGVAAAALWASNRERRQAQERRFRNWVPVSLLGRGSMGEVWRAEHRLLRRPGALKFIRPEALGAEDTNTTTDAIARFEREARTTALLSSPHTIELYDFGLSEGGELSYVMEFLDGEDLDTLLEKHGPLPPARVVHLLRQVCISLAEAHLEQFVHRDLKPANIYVCRQGIEYDFVKVLDFGMVADRRQDDGVEIVGTPAYVAPEIVSGRAFDHRADIYSLGCVAFKLLTGRTVFLADDPRRMMACHVHDRPDAPSHHAKQEIPRALDILVLDCLHKDPAARVSSAVELSRRLAACEITPRWTAGQAMHWWREHGAGGGGTGDAPSRGLEATVRELAAPGRPESSSAIHRLRPTEVTSRTSR